MTKILYIYGVFIPTSGLILGFRIALKTDLMSEIYVGKKTSLCRSTGLSKKEKIIRINKITQVI